MEEHEENEGEKDFESVNLYWDHHHDIKVEYDLLGDICKNYYDLRSKYLLLQLVLLPLHLHQRMQ